MPPIDEVAIITVAITTVKVVAEEMLEWFRNAQFSPYLHSQTMFPDQSNAVQFVVDDIDKFLYKPGNSTMNIDTMFVNCHLVLRLCEHICKGVTGQDEDYQEIVNDIVDVRTAPVNAAVVERMD